MVSKFLKIFGKRKRPMGIYFKMDYEKAIETLVWLSSQKPGISLHDVANILFYADKLHINLYARPVIGDTYLCMDYGPVPSAIKDLIAKSEWVDQELLNQLFSAISLDSSPSKSITPKRRPKMEFFSDTDLECLKESVRVYSKSSKELKDLSKGDQCWLSAGPNQPIDYALLVDQNNPNRDDIIEEMYEMSQYLQV